MSRTLFLTLIALLFLLGCGAPPMEEEPMEPAMVAVDDQPAGEYVRFADASGAAAWGRIEGGEIVVLHAAPWAGGAPTGDRVARDGATLLAPADPGKVIAIGLNYASHLGGREPAPYPGVFAKLPGSIVGPGDAIEMTEDAGNVHYEGELVLVVGKEARDVSMEQAQDYIFGVTAGNDVSERDWQSADLQWFRAKASDTYGPIGPVISRGVDYDDLELTTRLKRGSRPAAADQRPDLRHQLHRELPEPLRGPDARGRDLHRDPRDHPGDERGRPGLGRGRDGRRAGEPGRPPLSGPAGGAGPPR